MTKKKTKDAAQEWHHLATVEDLGGLKRKIRISYDAEGVKMAFDKATKEVGKNMTVKGFRRGRAPAQLVRSFCKKQIEEAASSLLSQEGYLHALFENGLSPMGGPKVEDAEFHMDGTFSCEITVEVRPALEASGYVGLQLERPPSDLSRIKEGLLDELRRGFSVVEDKEKAEPGLTLVADLFVSADGDPVLSQESQLFHMTEEERGPLGLDLSGLAVGEELEGPAVLPEDQGGKQARARVVLRRAMLVRPASDDELVQRLKGSPDFKDVEELRIEDVRARVGEQAKRVADRQARAALEEQAVDRLLEAHEFEVPSEWIDAEESHLRIQLGLAVEAAGKEDAEVSERVRSMAERNVRRSFMLDAVYDAEPGLKVTKEEYERTVSQEASARGVSAVLLRKKLKREGRVDEVVSFIKNRKIMDYLLANAEIRDKGEESFSPLEL